MTEAVTIDKLVYGGEGLGRLPSGEVIFVPWSAPGDTVTVTCHTGSRPLRGEILEPIAVSPLRAEPPCPVFGACGGCQWQHIQPAYQREWKQRIVTESLSRLGKLPDVPVLETLGSDETAWHYRNRVQWEVDTASDELGARDFRLGYYRAGSHEVVEFDQCWIIPAPLNAVAACLRDYVHQNPAVSSALLRVEAMLNREGQVLLVLEGELHARLNALIKAVSETCPAVLGVVHREKSRGKTRLRVLSGQGYLTETLGGLTFKVSAGSFFQTNPAGAEAILQTLSRWLLPDSHSLLDLYAGVGTFALALKDRFPRIVAVESSPHALQDAHDNIAHHGVAHVEMKTGDARRVLAALSEDFDVAVLDPPRAGCPKEILDWVSQHVQKQVLYVSCNPTTLARDLRILADQGWRIEAVQPIDMFPQTYHIEAVANLLRP